MAYSSADFEFELDLFRREVESGIQFLYSYLAIHGLAAKYKPVKHTLNEAPLFWNTILGALQTGMFIVPGRIFDQDSKHNVDRLLMLTRNNRQLFLRQSLRRRKAVDNNQEPDWLDKYVADAHEPTANDFRELRIHVKRWRQVYNDKYRDIRRKYYAHRELSQKEEIDALFSKTQIRELQTMFLMLHSIYEALWGLYHNGQKPIVRRRRVSLERMLRNTSSSGSGSDIHVRLVSEAKEFLLECSKRPAALITKECASNQVILS